MPCGTVPAPGSLQWHPLRTRILCSGTWHLLSTYCVPGASGRRCHFDTDVGRSISLMRIPRFREATDLEEVVQLELTLGQSDPCACPSKCLQPGLAAVLPLGRRTAREEAKGRARWSHHCCLPSWPPVPSHTRSRHLTTLQPPELSPRCTLMLCPSVPAVFLSRELPPTRLPRRHSGGLQASALMLSPVTLPRSLFCCLCAPCTGSAGQSGDWHWDGPCGCWRPPAGHCFSLSLGVQHGPRAEQRPG